MTPRRIILPCWRPGALLLIFISLFYVVLRYIPSFSHKSVSPQVVNAFEYAAVDVAYVYDGDTIRLSNGEKVRFVGIDTPESSDNKKLRRDARRSGTSAVDILRMGHQASRYTKSLLEGRKVRLEFDIEKRDKYGRLLAYVYRVDDGLFVNEDIIRNGYAYPMSIPPNIRYADKFRQAFRSARKNNAGLWQDSSFQTSL
ncbi:MAG: thermonuclease family protein [Candidatus Omnitrophota bacterium]